MRRPVEPPRISFRIIDDFLAFEEVDEDIYNDLIRIFSKYIFVVIQFTTKILLQVGYCIYLGQVNPVECAAEYFRSVFPEDEEISSHLTLNGRTGPGRCKLLDSCFAQICQDVINNKHLLNPNKVEFDEVLEKALKS